MPKNAGAVKDGVRVVNVGSLDDLERIETTVEIQRPDGATLKVPIISLTADELLIEQRAVKWPTPPETLVPTKGGGRPQLVKDFEDAEYKAKQQEAAAEYSYRIVFRSLAGAGITFPGETEDEKREAMQRKIGAWALTPLATIISRLNGVTPQDLEAAQQAFPMGAGSN